MVDQDREPAVRQKQHVVHQVIAVAWSGMPQTACEHQCFAVDFFQYAVKAYIDPNSTAGPGRGKIAPFGLG